MRNIVALGGFVALFAVIGRDTAGTWLRSHCAEVGVENFWLKEDPSRPTTVKTRVVARNQQIVRIDQEQVGDIRPETEAEVISEIGTVVRQVKAVVISDYGKGFVTGSVVSALVEGARAEAIPVLVDPKGLDFSKYQGSNLPDS